MFNKINQISKISRHFNNYNKITAVIMKISLLLLLLFVGISMGCLPDNSEVSFLISFLNNLYK